MVHQAEALESDEKLIIVNAPTSSGKTLAMLARFLCTHDHAIFVYPTNELIVDQANGISELLAKLGVKSVVIPMEEDNTQYGEIEGDIIIAVVNGESLEGLCRTKGESIRLIFQKADERRLLMLTNLDTLLLLFKMRYFGGRYLLSEFLHRKYSLLAIDELHTYWGVSLANLFNLVWLLRDVFPQIMMSSATISDSIKPFTSVFKDRFRIIKPPTTNNENDSRQIRHTIRLKIVPIENILSSDLDLHKVIAEIENLFDQSSKSKIDTLVIVNSVIFAEKLANALEARYGKGMVGRIHGLVPHAYRKRGLITVATSAVEVGVDFDVEHLVFEATNMASFVQRLGRCGRHRPSSAVAFIPSIYYRPLTMKIKEPNMLVRFADLIEMMRMPHLENYANFVTSIYGAILLSAIFYSVESAVVGEKVDYEKIKNALRTLSPPCYSNYTLNQVIEKAPPKVLQIISQGGARGDILTVPVFFEKFNSFTRLDVFDVAKTKFQFRKTEELGVDTPPWLKTNRVAVIEDVASDSDKICGVWSGSLLNRRSNKIAIAKTTGESSNLSIHCTDENLKEQLGILLNEKIVHSTVLSQVKDWRLPRIYSKVSRKNCLIIGLDALVQKFLEEVHCQNLRISA
jgi:CRISPR-associated helicase Cas3